MRVTEMLELMLLLLDLRELEDIPLWFSFILNCFTGLRTRSFMLELSIERLFWETASIDY